MKQIDSIRNMNADELAKQMVELECCWNCSAFNNNDDICNSCGLVIERKKWLESEVKDNDRT